MSRLKTAQELFRRHRRPGDLVFAVAFLAISVFLLYRLPDQVIWAEKTRLVSQPALFPTIAVVGMTLFAALHCVGSVCSARIYGRWAEVAVWARALEYGGWFLAYVLLLPTLGYLPSSLLFALALSLRIGYRSARALGLAALLAVVIVLLFRGLLRVSVPSGAIYQYLPDGLRRFAQIYL